MPLQVTAEKSPTVQELLECCGVSMDRLRSLIVKGELQTDMRRSLALTGPAKPGATGTGKMYKRFEVRSDGRRVAHRSYYWGNVQSLKQAIPADKPAYLSNLWDGTYYMRYSRGSNGQGRVVLNGKQSDYEIQRLQGSQPGAFGVSAGTTRRLDKILQGAGNVSVRRRERPEKPSPLYVLVADTNHGRYTVHLEPEHGYLPAYVKVQLKARQGHKFYGRSFDEAGLELTWERWNLKFRKIHGSWVPVETEQRYHRFYKRDRFEDNKTHTQFTEMTLNPDHEALNSFYPDDVHNGTPVFLRNVELEVDADSFTWRDGRVVDDNGNGVVNLSAQGTSCVQTMNISIANLDRSRSILSGEDEFITSMSAFDRSIRMKTADPVSEERFLHFLSTNALSWKAEEITKIRRIVDCIRSKISGFNLSFPKTVLLVKTTGKEELGGTYTRRNAIIIPEKTLDLAQNEIEAVIIDELFHIFLRHNRKLRDALCELIGFGECNEIEIPPQLLSSKTTDPDAPKNDHYIAVSYENSIVNVIPIILAVPGVCKLNERGMSCYSSACKLLVIERTGETWEPKFRDSQPVLLDISEVSGFFEKVGRNSNLIFHPEEILADNFVMLVNGKRDVPTPGIILEMKKLLTK